MSSSPPLPTPPAHPVRALLAFRPAPRRLGFAVRASICMGVPVLAGVLAGHPSEGLLGTIGAFTSLYGGGKPYAYRAVMLALVAIGMALSVTLGIAAAPWHITALLAMSFVAMSTTLLCRELNTGPPGAYLFVIACAAGTALPTAHLTATHIAVLVLGGGAFAWLAHMTAALFGPREPEKRAVLLATRATADFIRAVDTGTQEAARHRAALALHDAWGALVTYQPLRRRAERTLGQLRAINRDLHLLFADAIGVAMRGDAVPPGMLTRAKQIAERARQPRDETPVRSDDIPLGRLTAAQSLRQALQPGSMARLVVLRVGIAALVAGMLGAAMALDHVYWSIAAAVLVLHVGYDWRQTVQRGLARLIGTWTGLLLAAVVLALHPQGLWLVAFIMVLQFVVEMLVVRNYAVAVIAITALALLIATGGGAAADVRALLLARGVDTTVGCLVGIAVYALVKPRAASARVLAEVLATLDAVPAVVVQLRNGAVTSREARTARRGLQHRLFMLAENFDAAIGGTARERREAERMWPDIAAVQRVAYEVLSMCWKVEHGESPLAGEIDALQEELDQLRVAIARKAGANA